MSAEGWGDRVAKAYEVGPTTSFVNWLVTVLVGRGRGPANTFILTTMGRRSGKPRVDARDNRRGVATALPRFALRRSGMGPQSPSSAGSHYRARRRSARNHSEGSRRRGGCPGAPAVSHRPRKGGWRLFRRRGCESGQRLPGDRRPSSGVSNRLMVLPGSDGRRWAPWPLVGADHTRSPADSVKPSRHGSQER